MTPPLSRPRAAGFAGLSQERKTEMSTYTASIGTISHGTLRAVDLLESFSDELERLDHDDDFASLIREARACLDRFNDDDDDADDDNDDNDDETAELVNDLCDALDSFAPPLCYFGAHPGDSSDFGFWPCEDSIDRAVQEGDAMRVESGLDDVMAALRDHVGKHHALPGYIVEVNDHGNVTVSTLVDVTLQEVWSCV